MAAEFTVSGRGLDHALNPKLYDSMAYSPRSRTLPSLCPPEVGPKLLDGQGRY